MTVVEGNHIRVDRACPPRKKLRGESTPLYDNKRTVFVGNLPFDVKEAAHSVVKKQNLKLRDRELRLSHAKADAATLSKRPYSSRPSHAKADTATPSKRLYSSPAQAHSTPAKLSVASRSPSSTNNRSNRKATASYQGLRATKSDVHKKTHGGEKRKERMTKRPSVAARKAKVKMHKEGGAPKQAGSKRKLDSRTPDAPLRNKKAKKNK